MQEGICLFRISMQNQEDHGSRLQVSHTVEYWVWKRTGFLDGNLFV